LALLRDICSCVSIPVVAIGGIGPGNVRGIIAAGADGIAVISAVVGEEDISGAARRMKVLIESAKTSLYPD
jgi:thiamine-phosphate pyrophosphorylase